MEKSIFLILLLPNLILSLNNGVGITPPMGYSP